MIKYNAVILIIIVFVACSSNENNIQQVKFIDDSSLILLDSLIYENNDSSAFIGIMRDLEIVKNKIFISDRSKSKIHVFDDDLNYLKSFGLYGKGPHEFTQAPYLTKINDTLVVFDRSIKKLFYYNTNLEVVREITLPYKFFYMTHDPVIIGDRIIMSANNKLVRKLNGNISGLTTVLIIDRQGRIIDQCASLLDDYYKNSDLLYFALNSSSNISRGFDNSFFVLQLATYKIQQFDYYGKLMKIFEYKPKFYKTPPDVKANFYISDIRKLYKVYYSRATYFYGLFFDPMTNLLLVGYRTLHADEYQTKSFLDADNYLFILNKNGECILDAKIPGYVAAADNGIVYVVVEESDEKLVILKYKIEKKFETNS
ncbi:6-bladed beta-propeller [Melioribacteraceae bacterium 4301-Me]|uniref:6-bladed beta-propeller n=1 Tax=Pyranulibacter aquaticus TaxID=3163344 RepID=UPI00359BD21B